MSIGFIREEQADASELKGLFCKLAEIQYELTVFRRLIDNNKDLAGVIPDIWNNRLQERRDIWKQICTNPVMAAAGGLESQVAELKIDVKDCWGNSR